MSCAALAACTVLALAAPAYAGPSNPSSPSPTSVAAPTVDPAAPTPTAPYPAGPPQGFAPDGSTIGGQQLDTRGQVTVSTTAVPADVTAKGFLVADLDTGAVLAAQDPHGRYYPASTLKTLLVATLFPTLDPNAQVVVTADDVNIEGSAAGLVAGGTYPVLTLWQAVFLQSDNQAAHALARTAGSVPGTVALMNEHARYLHAYDTVAGTPNGLDVAGQSSSPYDLCLFMREIVDNPAMLTVAQTRIAMMPPEPPDNPAFQFQNQNKLLANYPGTLAGKTGFTDAARHTFVAAATRGNRRLVVSLMDGEQQPVLMWEQAAHLLDWAFATDPTTTGVGRLVRPGDYPPPQPATSSSALVPSATSATGAPKAATRTSSSGVPLVPVLVAGVALIAVLGLLVVVGRRRGRHT